MFDTERPPPPYLLLFPVWTLFKSVSAKCHYDGMLYLPVSATLSEILPCFMIFFLSLFQNFCFIDQVCVHIHVIGFRFSIVLNVLTQE